MGRWQAAGLTEGPSTPAVSDQTHRNALRITQNLGRRYSDYLDTLVTQPGVSNRIATRPVTHIVRNAIDLHADLRLCTVKVEEIWLDRMLLAETDLRLQPQLAPQQRLG